MCKKTKRSGLMAGMVSLLTVFSAVAGDGSHWNERVWRFVLDRTVSEKTGLIYDYLTDDTPDGHIKHLPSPEDIAEDFPIPTGWGTGMEDSVLNGAPFLLGAMRRHDVTGDEESLKAARMIFDGLCRCAEIPKTRGFLARSISPFDGRSYYSNSSRDQYTLFVYALWRYWGWSKATAADKERCVKILVDIARYTERCMTPENDFTLLRDDGGPAFVCKMWTATPCKLRLVPSKDNGNLANYGGIAAHEALRLPEIYAAAYAVSGDAHWRRKELEVADQGIEMSFGEMRKVMWGYALYQMQISIRLLWELETDPARRAKYLGLLGYTADNTDGFTKRARDYCEELKYDFSAPATDWRMRPFKYMGSSHTKYVPAPIGGKRYLLPSGAGTANHKVHVALREVAESVLILQLCPGRRIPEERMKFLDKVFSSVDYARFYNPCGAAHAVLAYWQSRKPLEGGAR